MANTLNEPAPGALSSWGNRTDGTPKGAGFYGPVSRPDGGVSTELSVGVNLGGKDREIPLMVPGLTKSELDYLLNNDSGSSDFLKKLPPSIMDKAVDFAKQRISQSKSPYADANDKRVGIPTGPDLNKQGRPVADSSFNPFSMQGIQGLRFMMNPFNNPMGTIAPQMMFGRKAEGGPQSPAPWASTTQVPDYATAGYDPTTQQANIPMPPQRPTDLYSSSTAPAGGLGNAPMPMPRPQEFGGSQGSAGPQYVQDDGSNNAYWLNERARQEGAGSPQPSMGSDAESNVGQGAQNFFDRFKANSDKAGFKMIDDNSILGKLGNMGGPVQKGDGILPIFLKSLMNY